MSKMIECKTCGKEIAKNAKSCPGCGAKNKKPIFKRWWFIVIVLIVIIAAVSSGGSKNNQTDTAKETASTSNSKEATQVEKSVPKREVLGVATDLSTGTFLGGKDVKAGLYEVTPLDSQGNFTIKSSDGNLKVNEILGKSQDMGVSQVRVKISDNDEIQLQGIKNVHFEPVTTEFQTSVVETKLHSGEWIVGEDIVSGRYKVTAPSGTGNFVIFDGSMPVTNEILGGETGVKEVSVNLKDKERIEISNLNEVKFEPAN